MAIVDEVVVFRNIADVPCIRDYLLPALVVAGLANVCTFEYIASGSICWSPAKWCDSYMRTISAPYSLAFCNRTALLCFDVLSSAEPPFEFQLTHTICDLTLVFIVGALARMLLT